MYTIVRNTVFRTIVIIPGTRDPGRCAALLVVLASLLQLGKMRTLLATAALLDLPPQLVVLDPLGGELNVWVARLQHVTVFWCQPITPHQTQVDECVTAGNHGLNAVQSDCLAPTYVQSCNPRVVLGQAYQR